MISSQNQGKVYDLYADRIRLGRNADNDIVIVSDAVSRHHATIEQTQDGNWCVLDNQSKNGISVNGVRVDRAVLAQGDLVQVGDFIFRFNANTPDSGVELESASEMPGPGGGLAHESFAPVATSSGRKAPNKRVLIYGIAGLIIFAVWLLNSGGNKSGTPAEGTDASAEGQSADGDKKDADKKLARDFTVAAKPDLNIATPEGKPIGREDPVLTQAEQEISKIDLSNTPAVQAEQYYRRGQREYINRNYERAIDDFRTSLTLNRSHELASKYLALAVHESEAQAKVHMENGVRYFESLQYQRAIYDFKQVIELMQHRPTEPIIGEAEKYITICKQRLQAAELLQ